MNIKEFFNGFKAFKIYKNEIAFGIRIWEYNFLSGLYVVCINSSNPKPFSYFHWDSQTMWTSLNPFSFKSFLKKNNIKLNELARPYWD